MSRPSGTFVVGLTVFVGLVATRTAFAKPCRKPGVTYDAKYDRYPLCKTAHKPTFGEELDATFEDIQSPAPVKAAPTPPPRPRAPASTPPVKAQSTPVAAPVAAPAPIATTAPRRVSRQPAMSYESYLHANAKDPALSTHVHPTQEAFKDYARPAVITGSTLDAQGDDANKAGGTKDAAGASAGNAGGEKSANGNAATNAAAAASAAAAAAGMASGANTGFNSGANPLPGSSATGYSFDNPNGGGNTATSGGGSASDTSAAPAQ